MIRRLAAQDVQLGSLTSVIADGARWWDEDAYPSAQGWADEAEKLLSFAVCKGIFEKQFGALRGNAKQRKTALNEIRVAFFFERNSFPLLEWAPAGRAGATGEFIIGGPNGERIFIEVKGPSWEGELWGFRNEQQKVITPQQRENVIKRIRQSKYINAEARSFDNSDAIRFAIEKGYHKFEHGPSNLLVIADDLFVGLAHDTHDHFAKKALYCKPDGCFAARKYSHLGGVLFFWTVAQHFGGYWENIFYGFRLFTNDGSDDQCSLPFSFRSAFRGTSYC